MFPFDFWVLFEEVYPDPSLDLMMTFRAHAHVSNDDGLWAVSTYEVKSATGRDTFLAIPRGEAVWQICSQHASSDAGYEVIEAAVEAEIADRRAYAKEQAAFDRADDLKHHARWFREAAE